MKNSQIQLFMVSFLFAVICLSTSSCSNADSKMKNTKPTPQATLAPTEEEKEANAKKQKELQVKAFTEFLNLNHPGWVQKGLSSGSFMQICLPYSVCYLNISKGKEEKVIPVVLREFTNTDGDTYWNVSKATELDLSQNRIDEIKLVAVDLFRDNEMEEECFVIGQNEREIVEGPPRDGY